MLFLEGRRHQYRDVNASDGDPCPLPVTALGQLGTGAFHFQGKLLKSSLPAPHPHSTLSLPPPNPFSRVCFLLHCLSFSCVEVV